MECLLLEVRSQLDISNNTHQIHKKQIRINGRRCRIDKDDAQIHGVPDEPVKVAGIEDRFRLRGIAVDALAQQQSEQLLEAGETSDIEMKHSQDQKDVGNPVEPENRLGPFARQLVEHHARRQVPDGVIACEKNNALNDKIGHRVDVSFKNRSEDTCNPAFGDRACKQ